MIGIVAEGPADIAVIRNILKGKLGIDANQSIALLPKLARDATDLAAQKTKPFKPKAPKEFSNWTMVLEECETQTLIKDFLAANPDDAIVIVQIDTAEAHLPGYDVTRPDRKAADYVERLCELVRIRISRVLGDSEKLFRYAIAVEETEAWLLTLHDSELKKDTGTRLDPKKRLKFVQKSWVRGGPNEYELGHTLSKGFRKSSDLHKAAEHNASLRLFLESLEARSSRDPSNK